MIPSLHPRRAYLLSGGQSRRFGSDKARALVDGQPNLLRLANVLHRADWSVTIVAQRESEYSDLSLRCIADFAQDAGPLVGVITALRDCEAHHQSRCWIATCDLLELDTIRVDRLWQYAESVEEWIVCMTPLSFAPFPGTYATAILPTATQLWGDGQRSVRSLFEALGKRVSAMSVDAMAGPTSFNTPEELQRWEGRERDGT